MRPNLVLLTSAISMLLAVNAWSDGIAIIDADIDVNIGIFVCLEPAIYATIVAGIGEQRPPWTPTTITVRPTSTPGNGGGHHFCTPVTISVPAATTATTTSSITVTTTTSLPGTVVTVTRFPSTGTVTDTVTDTVTQTGTTEIETTTVTDTVAQTETTEIETTTITAIVTQTGTTEIKTVTESLPGPNVTLPGTVVTDTLTVTVSETGTTLPGTTPPGTTVATTVTLSICPSRIVNPTYTPPGPLPSDYTWGCPPGFLCHPRNTAEDGDCNFEAGPPADTYFCSPDECVPSPKLVPNPCLSLPASSDEIRKFNVTQGYFNLNPEEFGLNYSIFAFPEGIQLQQRSLIIGDPALWTRQTGGAPVIPGVCYDECNQCMLDAESAGKTPALCSGGSAFETLLQNCNACIEARSTGSTTGGPLPDFQQYLSYCETVSSASPPPPLPEMQSTSTPSSSSSISIVASSTPGSSPTSQFGSSTPIQSSGPIESKTSTSSPAGASSPLPISSTPALTVTSTPTIASTIVNQSTRLPSTPNTSPAISSSPSNATAPSQTSTPSTPSPPLYTGAGTISSPPLGWLFGLFATVGFLFMSFL